MSRTKLTSRSETVQYDAMNNLTFNDVMAFLIYLLGVPKRAELDAIDAAKPFATMLDQTLTDMQAVPPETYGGAPNAEQLDVTDEKHDGAGKALYFLALAYQASPDASADAKATAKLILDSYVPGKSHLRASYATEAARAQTRQSKLATDKEVLDRIPVEGGTAHAWASTYVQAGVELGMLLSGRADATGTRSDAGNIRGQAIHDIGVLRELIARALRRTPDAAKKADHDLFGYLDLLAAMRDRGSNDPTPPPPAPPPQG